MDDMTFENFFKIFLNNAFVVNKDPAAEQYEDVKCRNCGMTLGKFKKIGRLGCSVCYDSFKEQLSPIIKGVQGGEVHTGKIPANVSGELLKKRQIDRLRAEIVQAVAKEEYEKAAFLRDQIKSMSGEGGA